MRVIKRVADSGITVVATVHQPSSAVFLDFTHLTLLVPGGYQAYSGPIGKRAALLVGYLEGLSPNVPRMGATNPASYMLDVVGMDDPTTAEAPLVRASSSAARRLPGRDHSGSDEAAGTPAVAAKAVEAAGAGAGAVAPAVGGAAPAAVVAVASVPPFARLYAASPLAVREKAETATAAAAAAATAGGTGGKLQFATAMPSSLATQVAVVFVRTAQKAWRNRIFNTIRLGVVLFIALFFGLTFYRLTPTDQAGVLSILGLCFSAGVFSGIVMLNTLLPHMFQHRPVFYRERAARYYRPEAYSIANIAVELPWIAGYSLLFCAISYFLHGFRPTASAFFTYYLAHYLQSIAFASLGTLYVAVMPTVELASIITGISITLINLFAGINIPVTEMRSHSSWFYYVNLASHAVRLSSLSQFNPVDDANLIELPGRVFMTAYDYAVSRLGMRYDDRWAAAGWLVLIIGIFNILAFAANRWINHQKR